MRDWKIERSETLYSHLLLDLQRRELACGDDRREVLVMEAPEWINIIPLQDDGRVVMVRQWRYGIQAPTLVLHGAEDMLVLPENGRAIAQQIPDAEFELIEHSGHLPMLEQPQTTADQIRHFLRPDAGTN